MYRVIEVAKMLNVSKVTIYKKIRQLKSEINPFIVKEKNVTYILNEGIELIKETLLKSEDGGNTLEPSLKIIALENQLKKTSDHLVDMTHSYTFLKSDHLNELINIKNYLVTIEKSKREYLGMLDEIIVSLKNILTDIDEQIDLFEELEKHCS